MVGTLLWISGNLLLACIPVALAFTIARGLRRDAISTSRIRWMLWLPLLVTWLLFLPNTCYLLTEWRHYLCDIHDRSAYYPIYGCGQYPAGATFSLLLLTAFYFFTPALACWPFSLRSGPLYSLARQRWGRRAEPLRAAVCLLCPLGVYLGLVSRFNSWDVVHPARAEAILSTAFQTLARPALLLSVCVFAAVLWLCYTVFDTWMNGLARRRNSTRETFPKKDYPHASV